MTARIQNPASRKARAFWLAIVAGTLVLAGCAAPAPTTGAIDDLKADLDALADNNDVAELAPLALANAREAVRKAGREGLNEQARDQHIWLARKSLEIARARAFAERARNELEAVEDQRAALLIRASRAEVTNARRQAEQAMLESTATREEMQRAREQANSAESRRQQAARDAADARAEAEQARKVAEAQSAEVELARREAELASETAQSFKRRLDYMEYRQTDRGVVVTLGDVLFEVGEATLRDSAQASLRDVIDLLESEPGKQIRIEGHTDSTGAANFNLRLSEQRAESVRDALIDRGISASRIKAVGMGEDFPIASNDTAEGRASNRRVDVIVLDAEK